MICENESGKASVGYSGVLERILKKGGTAYPKTQSHAALRNSLGEKHILWQEQRFHDLSV
jgi:hypothetical protein